MYSLEELDIVKTKVLKYVLYKKRTENEVREKFTDVEALVGYLNVPNTTIDDAVVQAKDNNYFLRKDKYGKYSYSGSYFADYKCDMNNLSKSTIIYGHNLMDETRYFGQLMKYKSLDFYKSTPVITFDIKQKACRWKVFSVFYANTVKTDSRPLRAGVCRNARSDRRGADGAFPRRTREHPHPCRAVSHRQKGGAAGFGRSARSSRLKVAHQGQVV